MRNIGLTTGFVVGMVAAGGCLGDMGGDSTADDKIHRVLTGLGFDPNTAVVDAEGIIVEGDIRIWQKDFDAYLESFQTGEKGYVCTAGQAGADGKGCAITLNPRNVIFSPNSIRVAIAANVPVDWRLAFRRASAVWMSSYLNNNAGMKLVLDAENRRGTNVAYTINIEGVANGSLPAQSSFPAPGVAGFMAPGTLIQVSTLFAQFPQSQKDAIALHELGHTLGFQHPSGAYIPGTAQWTNASVTCGTGAGTYPTVMCVGNNGRKFLSNDDIVSAQNLYSDQRVFNLMAWDSQFCTALYPCGAGEGHCTMDMQCQGFQVCLDTVTSQNLYGAPSGGRVCGPPATVRNEGITACSSAATETRCFDTDCPCGVGQGDCDNDQECVSGLVCGNTNGPAVGLARTVGVCKHPRPPGCAAFNPNMINSSLCTPSCPCSLGEGDCDTDVDCIGDLVCGQNVGGRFGLSSTLDLCMRPGV